MTINVPASWKTIVDDAAKSLGISPNVVAAQISEESGFQTGLTSSMGAYGPFQFEPGTWASVMPGVPFSQANDPAVAEKAYVKLMSQLLKENHGSVQDALAAYNAGQGDLSAGMGYADTILKNAGEPVNYVSGSGSSSSDSSGGKTQDAWATQDVSFPGAPWVGDLETFATGPLGLGMSLGSTASGIGHLAQAAGEMANDFTHMFKLATWLFEPQNWLRVGAFAVGVVAFSLGLYMFLKSNGVSVPVSPAQAFGGSMPIIPE
jgi:hypothetical protein